MKVKRLAFAVLVSLLCATTVFAGAKITIVNADPAGKGFNDPTPATPVGGNNGMTLGDQRLNVFRYAADIWGKLINSNVEIIVSAKFSPITSGSDTCNVLGQAGPMDFVSDFDNAPKQNVWYPIALANALAGRDLKPDEPDIQAQFNAALDTDQCTQFKWYYGLDGNHGDKIDLAVVLLHELAHGLGISGTTQLSTGQDFDNTPSVHELHALDLTTGLHWDQMTDAQRQASATNGPNLVWDGRSTRTASNDVLGNPTTLTVLQPAAIARNYTIGIALFGAPADKTVVTGTLVAALDPANVVGPTTTDGCSAYTNASDVSGNIAVVDRGTCTFLIKAQNAQAAGAKALVILNNDRSGCGNSLITMVASGDASGVVIPLIMIGAADGDAVRAQLPNGVRATLHVDLASLAGATSDGMVRLYAPCALEQGSSVFHWDTTAFPNLLMEPAINPDLPHTVDLTINQLIDLGWARSPNSGPPSGRRILKRGVTRNGTKGPGTQ